MYLFTKQILIMIPEIGPHLPVFGPLPFYICDRAQTVQNWFKLCKFNSGHVWILYGYFIGRKSEECITFSIYSDCLLR